jgi:transglutaminase-like putative cysteine protease
MFEVRHETHYEYSGSVELAQHLAYLRPCQDDAQIIERHALAIAPEPSWQIASIDSFDNHRQFFSMYAPHRELKVIATSRVGVRARYAEADFAASLPWEEAEARMRYLSGVPWRPECEFSFASPYVPLHRDLYAYARESFTDGRPIALAAIELMQRIYGDFEYEVEATEISTPLIDAFRQRQGVCQDFAHILIACVRSLGLAARYVSGYLLTHSKEKHESYIGADASHAWASVHCPGLGANSDWLDLDPTNDLVPGNAHVTLARGRDYGDVTPLRGIIRGGGDHDLAVAVSVIPDDFR